MVEPVVLIVDDEPNVVRLCQRLLERANFRVISATSPSQALAVLSREPINLVLADIRMPGLDGFQLVSLARRRHPEVAAVIMTGFGGVETALAALQQGADGLVLKPFTNTELVQTVERALIESQNKRDAVRLRTLRPLFTIVEELFAEKDPGRLLEKLVEVVYTHLGCSSACIYTQEGQRAGWHPQNLRGDPLPGVIEGPDADLFAPTAGEQRYLSVHGESLLDGSTGEFLSAQQLVSLLLFRLDSPAGRSYLWASRRAGEAPFGEADQEMFLILGRQALGALENARLYEELKATLVQVEKSQQALVQAEKMSAAGRLTASIAHEINNPLQSLNNCLHLAGRKELSLSERNRYLTLAQNELNRLMHTVQRMLDFYRPGARDRQLTDVNRMVESVLQLLGQQLRENQIQVHSRFWTPLPPVMAVPSQIQQVLINLIINAMEAMPKGGELTISTAPGMLDGVAEPGSTPEDGLPGVEVLIQDTGPGVPEADRERIFEPFVSTKENGTGLGLAVSYGIIMAHGGAIHLKESQGTGACFRIYLPEDGGL